MNYRDGENFVVGHFVIIESTRQRAKIRDGRFSMKLKFRNLFPEQYLSIIAHIVQLAKIIKIRVF